jgi:polysaccharide chain length determinant protein (PEP-CTERM system associated)
MEERSLHLLDYVSVVKRRKWWLITPIVVSLLAGAVLAIVLPREYESSTTIAVTTPSMATDLVKSSAADLAERVRAISQELLGREVLERVAREENLATESTLDGAVASIRSRTAVSPAKSLAPVGRTGPDAFLVTYTGNTPELTQRVANRLANVFVELHSKIRETRAEDTSAYLAGQLSQSQERLRTIEEKLRQMKETYMGRLPEQTPANLAMVAGLRQQQETTAMSLRSEQDRLAMIERQIEMMRRGAADAPLGRGSATAAERLVALRRELDDAMATYTDKHPEVQRLKSEIAAAAEQAKAESARPPAEREPALAADPEYRRLLADRESSRLRIRDHERATARASAEIARYQSRVEATPMVEQQLATLNREYELEKEQYNQLAGRRSSAAMAEDIERRRAGEQFTVLYPAYLPTDPKSPDVLRLMVVALLLGLVGGGALAFGREYLDRSVYDARALQSEFDLPVLAEIPHIAAR